ncbi:MAG: N-acetylmuramoyl-L-alanine amidase [Clostridia bacterium]|nr:N-acetylmuramoyl-L-alanine amidase [Clostridia bacterium]
MVGSMLVSEYFPAASENYTKGREQRKIRAVTVHHMAARWTAKRLGEMFQNPSRKASSHYGIGYKGEVAQYVSERDTAWTNGNIESNRESVTIECANESAGAPWPVSEATLERLVALLADIALRNGLGFLVKGENLTWHRMFDATACPGEYLLGKMDEIVRRANERIANNLLPEKEEAPRPRYRVYIGRWLPDVTGADPADEENGYAGILGKEIRAVQISLSRGDAFYRVHQKGGSWLPEVKNREDYAGILASPIDGLMLRFSEGQAVYRVHTVEDGWLPPVTGYEMRDSENGYAGILGHSIDGVLIESADTAAIS